MTIYIQNIYMQSVFFPNFMLLIQLTKNRIDFHPCICVIKATTFFHISKIYILNHNKSVPPTHP